MSHVDGDAKEMEEEVQALEQQERFQLLRTGQWTESQTQIWNERRGVADRAWDEASRLSFAAGFDFTDRSGVRRALTQESIVARAVRTYLEKIGLWPEVVGWKKKYGGRKRAGDKKGAKPKRFR